MKHMLYILSMFVIITIYTGLKEDLALLSEEEQEEVQRWPEELQRLLVAGTRIFKNPLISLNNPPEELQPAMTECSALMNAIQSDAEKKNPMNLAKAGEIATKLEEALKLYLANKKNN